MDWTGHVAIAIARDLTYSIHHSGVVYYSLQCRAQEFYCWLVTVKTGKHPVRVSGESTRAEQLRRTTPATCGTVPPLQCVQGGQCSDHRVVFLCRALRHCCPPTVAHARPPSPPHPHVRSSRPCRRAALRCRCGFTGSSAHLLCRARGTREEQKSKSSIRGRCWDLLLCYVRRAWSRREERRRGRAAARHRRTRVQRGACPPRPCGGGAHGRSSAGHEDRVHVPSLCVRSLLEPCAV